MDSLNEQLVCTASLKMTFMWFQRHRKVLLESDDGDKENGVLLPSVPVFMIFMYQIDLQLTQLCRNSRFPALTRVWLFSSSTQFY